MIRYAYTILYVKTVPLAVKFYENAFGLQRKFISPDNDYGEIETGSTVLAFASLSLAHSNLKEGFLESDLARQPFGVEIGFAVSNVDETVKSALLAGGTLFESPKIKPWGQIVAYIRDLDGFLVEICTPMT
jgi:predicted enzyme related to lactoylglutathione lyase